MRESSMRRGKSLRRDVLCTGAEGGLYDTPFHEQEALPCAAGLRMKGSRAKAAKQRSHAGIINAARKVPPPGRQTACL